jgi:hypothetical protein
MLVLGAIAGAVTFVMGAWSVSLAELYPALRLKPGATTAATAPSVDLSGASLMPTTRGSR